jgi:hypothetical protein
MRKQIIESELVLGADGISRLPELDINITHLNLANCTSLISLPENLPDGITYLTLAKCTGLTSLPDNLPAGITHLNLQSCRGLTSLPDNLPDGIAHLNLTNCTGLTSLPDNLPDGITHLNLSNCTGLTFLPENLPAGIVYLNLSDCTSLIFTPELIEKLQTLEEREVEIRYPSHFTQNSQVELAKASLDSAIAIYKTNNPDVPEPVSIKTLLHRFLSEGISYRGANQTATRKECIKEIVATTAPVLNLFTQNPDHLKWADEIAKPFLDGCINQPVAGWSEISAWTSIAQSQEVADKIAATKHLRVLDELRNHVAALINEGQGPGQEVEVEAGNALFREVHKKLLAEDDLTNPWLGVPKSIAYEGTITNWLTQERINEACDKAKIILAKSQGEVVEYLLEGHHRETWAQVAFPEEIAAIKKSYERKAEFLENAIEAISGSHNLEFENNEQVLEFTAEYLNQDGSVKKSKEELEASQASLSNDRDLAISERVVELTKAALITNLDIEDESQISTIEYETASTAADDQQNLNASETTQPERQSVEVVDATSCSPLSCSPLNQMFQRGRDFFSRR